MVERKLVKSGNTSYVISLPIEWIRRNNLKEGKLLGVREDDTGNLLVSAGKPAKTHKSEISTIKVDGKEEYTIYLEFLNSYIRDVASIIFEGEEIIDKDAKILDFISGFIGLDVIERGTDSIVVKNFFSLDQELSPDILLRKMDIVNRSSIELLMNYFTSQFANEDFFELQKLDVQTKRLFMLLRKVILKLLERPSLMSSMQTNHLQIMKNRVSAQSFLRVSYSLILIGRAFRFLDISKQETHKLHKHFETMYKDYKHLLNAVYNKTYDFVFGFLEDSVESQKKLENDLKLLADPLAVQTILSIMNIYGYLREVAYEAMA